MANKELVISGAGFLGSIISNFLAKKGYKVTIFDIFYDKKLAKKHNYYHGDLPQIKAIESCFKQYGPFNTVYHIATMLAHEIKNK